MRSNTIRVICLLACVALAIPALALQRGGADVVTGTWTGDWGPNAADRNTVSVDLKLDGKNVTGTVKSVNFKRPDVTLMKSTFDAAAGTVHMEADSGTGSAMVHFVIDGKVAGGTMSGSWNKGTTKGDFKLTKK